MDKVLEYKHKSGLQVFFVPKPGYSERYAMFTTKYGSVDSSLKDIQTGGILDVPLGIAHFLEHKLFEQEKGNVMQDYARMGAKPNAFTSPTQTSYLFSCSTNFEPCLKLLLHYVQNPYFTPENVEKEKGIIGQEINMYLDNPDSRVYMNLLKALYVENPVKQDIVGSIESISLITPDILYLLYHTFYTPKNMVLVIVGDEKLEDIQRIVDESIEPQWETHAPTGYTANLIQEPIGICEKQILCQMDVATPLFMFGYKDSKFQGAPLELAKKEIQLKLLHEILFGSSSSFYNELYQEGLINDSFYTFYELERSFAYSAFGGEAKDPFKVIERIQKRIQEAKRGELEEADFNRIKNCSYGSFIKRFNSIEGICRMCTSAALADISVFDYFSLYDKIDFNGVMDQLAHFDESKTSISIVNQK